MAKNKPQIESFYKFARALHEQHLDPCKIAQTVLTMTAELIGAQHGCIITLRDGILDRTFMMSPDPAASAYPEFWDAFLRRGIAGFVQHSLRAVVIRNVKTDPRWTTLYAPFVLPLGSAIGLPLKKDNYIYAILVYTHPSIDYFDDEIQEVLTEVVDLASVAMGNAQSCETVRMTDDRYQSLFEEAVVPILLTDLHGHILDVNRRACEFLKRERADLLRISIGTVHRIGNSALDDRLQIVRKNGESSFRTTARTADNQDVPVIVRARQMPLNDRQVIEWVEQDVTAQMELEQLRADLSAMVYHDLRGPLQTVKGSLYKLGQVLANHENPAVLNLLQVGIRSTRQLQRMVDSLLDIQRLEEGSAVLNLQPVELPVLLGDAAQLILPLASETGHRLQFEFGNNLPLVNLDNDMMMRVVINLMENAIKYTPDGGIIKLSARQKDGSIQISVRDSGPGIPHNMQHQIFDKFSRVKYKDAPKGIGLGLAFCRLAVEAHKGRIWVESELDSGSNFIFSIPLGAEKKTEPTNFVAAG